MARRGSMGGISAYGSVLRSRDCHRTLWDGYTRGRRPALAASTGGCCPSWARCDIARLTELNDLFKQAENNFFPPNQTAVNDTLYNSVMLTEFIDQPGSEFLARFDEIESMLKNRPIGNYTSWTLHLKELHGFEFFRLSSTPKSYATYRASTLILSAKYDLNTPPQIADDIRLKLEKANVPVELYRPTYAAHAVIATAINSKVFDGQCGMKRVFHFLNGSTAQSFSCTEQTIDWNFEDSNNAANNMMQLGYGRMNPWE